jgi:hypothetical protein
MLSCYSRSMINIILPWTANLAREVLRDQDLHDKSTVFDRKIVEIIKLFILIFYFIFLVYKKPSFYRVNSYRSDHQNLTLSLRYTGGIHCRRLNIYNIFITTSKKGIVLLLWKITLSN